MYFPVLEVLKASEGLDDKNIGLYDVLLYQIYKKYHSRFALRIYKKLCFPVDERQWQSILDQLTDLGYLSLNFELCCPDSYETIKVFKTIEEIPFGGEMECPNCGKELHIDAKDIFITYSFDDRFKPLPMAGKDLDFFRENQPTQKDSQLSLLDYYKLYPDLVYNRIIRKNRTSLEKIIKRLDVVDDSKRKGKLYELLARKMFESYYLKIYKRGKVNRTSTGQMDILFLVKRLEGTIFFEFSDIMVVECKNWDHEVNVKEVRDVSGKLTNIKSKTGMIFAKKGVTGNKRATYATDAYEEIRNFFRNEGKVILLITLKDIVAVLNGSNVYELLEEKYVSSKTF